MRTLRIVLLLGSFCAVISAQTAVVEHQASLRKDPSATQTPIATLLPEEKVTVLDSSSSPTYLKVKTPEGKVGWVFKKYLEVMAAPSAPPVPSPATSTGTSAGGGAAASEIDGSWDKPAPVKKTFTGSEGACPDKGDGGDTATNLRKNRVDPLPAPHDVTWAAINTLTYPAAKPSRLSWTPSELAQIKPYEGVALRVVGFLSQQVKVE